jgi:hypothetical protein
MRSNFRFLFAGLLTAFFTCVVALGGAQVKPAIGVAQPPGKEKKDKEKEKRDAKPPEEDNIPYTFPYDRDAKNQELEAAREHAAAGDVRASSDGVLLGTARGAGEEVEAGTPNLLRIAVNLSDLEAVVQPPPPVLARVRPGAEALVMFAETGDALAGRVREVAGTEVIVEFASPNPVIKPGMNAQVRLQLEAAAVPQPASAK